MQNNLPIPAGSDAITPEWLTNALRTSQPFKSAEVSAFKLEPLEIDGFVGETLRVQIEFTEQRQHYPPTLILKMASSNAEHRELIAHYRIYEREVRFYQELAGETEIRSPTCYYSAIEESGEQFVLLLEDLAPMRMVDQIAGCTKLEAELAIVALAKLHAAFWDRPVLQRLSWAPTIHSPEQMDPEIYLQKWWPQFKENIGDTASESFIAIGQSYGLAMADLALKKSRMPQTILHGDFRLDNLFFDSEKGGDGFAAIDWQLLKQGCGLCDFAYFVSLNLTTDLRRDIERSLLTLYYETLIQNGVTDYSIEQCRSDFRLSLIFPLNTMVEAGALFDGSSERGSKLLKVQLSRLTATLHDHNILELIEAAAGDL